MNILFIFTILIVGLSGIVAQVLVMRELLVSFNGNELSLSIVLANWVAIEALGVFVVGRFIDKARNKVDVFIILQILFSLALPLSIYLSRIFKNILGISTGETVGLYVIFYISFLVALPLGFCHGALFSVGCKINSLFVKEPISSIGKFYTWETIGTIVGGVILTYLFVPYLNSFQIAFFISTCNIFICLTLFKYINKKSIKYVVIAGALFIVYLFIRGTPQGLQQVSINKQWRVAQILDYRNSIYGNVMVTQSKEQRTFFYNGIPIITTPYPDITFVEEFAHLPLLFHPNPKDILVISGGAGGLISEILKHPINRLTYVELDPLIIEMLKKYSSYLINREIKNDRVDVINLDGRFFLKITPKQYDVVLIGLSKPSDLSTNRFFTQEFFGLVRNKLKPDGILALWLPGSLTYLSKELRDLNACIFNGLKDSYGYVRIIPGDYNIFLASKSDKILKVDSGLITQRMMQGGIKTNILLPAYISYRVGKNWLDWFIRSSVNSTRKINRDLAPLAVFEMLIFWNKQFSFKLSQLLQLFENLNLNIVFIFAFLLTLALYYVFRLRDDYPRLNIAYSILTTGFFGMLMNLVLIFSFQIFYGYLYYAIGILISIFMAGIAIGSIIMTSKLAKIKNDLSLFRALEASIILFSFFTAIFITKFFNILQQPMLIFIFLLFIPGFLIGLEFPLASKIYLRKKEEVGQTAGLLYFADLFGGWFAGIFAGIIFLPILGLFNSCMVIVFLKLSSLFLLKRPIKLA